MRKTILAALTALLTFSATARAETYPSHPITLIVPFSAGGPTDSMARILGERMQRSLGQTITIENVTGAAGSLGVGRVVRSPADGYTVSIGHLGTHVANGAIYKLG
jgi:tripartite-type tricarboxylate transporter receptor subunit TctC